MNKEDKDFFDRLEAKIDSKLLSERNSNDTTATVAMWAGGLALGGFVLGVVVGHFVL